MLTFAEKESLWRSVSSEFPSDPMLRDLHFVRALMATLRERTSGAKTYRELGLMAREEFSEWLEAHPEFAEK